MNPVAFGSRVFCYTIPLRIRINRGELEAIRVVLPGEIGAKLDYLMAATGEGKAELLSRLILEEWNRQGQPVGRPKRKHKM